MSDNKKSDSKKSGKLKMACPFVLLIIVLSILPLLIERIVTGNTLIPPFIPTILPQEIWFGFLGSYIGAIFTVFALVVTIKFTQKENRENQDMERRKLLADIKKERIEGKYETVYANLSRVKKYILLTDFELAQKSLFNKLSMGNPWNILLSEQPDNLIPYLKALELDSENECDMAFLNVVSSALESRQRILRELADNYLSLIEGAKEKALHPTRDEQIRIQIQAALGTKSKGAPQPAPKEIQAVFDKCKEELLACKSEYKDDFLTACENLEKRIEEKKQSEIEALYEAI